MAESSACYVQVDLFYRDPEESKEQEEDAMIPGQDYVAPEYSASLLANDQWPSQVADPQWVGEIPVVQPPLDAVPIGDWTAAAAPEWDSAATAPVPMGAQPTMPIVEATGWD